MTHLRCYARRRLQPFRGLVHTAEGDLMRAQTVNGTVWLLEAAAQQERRGWSYLDRRRVERTFQPYAYWSPTEGELRRLPLDPRLGAEAVHESAEAFKQALLETQARFPFAPDDPLELWLLDAESLEPLALMAAAAAGQPRPRSNGRWSAFRFQEEPPCALGSADAETPGRLAYQVEQAVNRRGNGVMQWFRRRPDGAAEGLDGVRLPPKLTGRTLPATAFPAALLGEDWSEPAVAARVRAYLERLAPRLLMLAALSDSQRRRWEAAAWNHYGLVHFLHRLYPRVLDPAGLKVALVKARLDQSAV